MQKVTIKKGQVWTHKVSGDKVMIYKKNKGDKWQILRISKELNSRSVHSVANETLWTKFNLVKK